MGRRNSAFMSLVDYHFYLLYSDFCVDIPHQRTKMRNAFAANLRGDKNVLLHCYMWKQYRYHSNRTDIASYDTRICFRHL